MKLVPLRVTIRRGKDGKAQYPDFNSMESELRDGGLDFAYFFDKYGGWLYDKMSGFGESDEYNPDPDTWFGVVLVPKAFADKALIDFPGEIIKMTEPEVEEFHNLRVTISEPEDFLDTNELLGIEARVKLETALGIVPDPDLIRRRNNAMNPNHPQLGVRKNKRKKFQDFKRDRGFTIEL